MRSGGYKHAHRKKRVAPPFTGEPRMIFHQTIPPTIGQVDTPEAIRDVILSKL